MLFTSKGTLYAEKIPPILGWCVHLPLPKEPHVVEVTRDTKEFVPEGNLSMGKNNGKIGLKSDKKQEMDTKTHKSPKKGARHAAQKHLTKTGQKR